ncbi:unnamed protein product [Effrenium voratum]|uniref:Uncharacterized protein n=1 Tax=Effrenium voratum TaxID=2562239 RepID=A0AA36IWC3_9DINO|nr:unnamed protein product [Effrenium voratum]
MGQSFRPGGTGCGQRRRAPGGAGAGAAAPRGGGLAAAGGGGLGWPRFPRPRGLGLPGGDVPRLRAGAVVSRGGLALLRGHQPRLPGAFCVLRRLRGLHCRVPSAGSGHQPAFPSRPGLAPGARGGAEPLLRRPRCLAGRAARRRLRRRRLRRRRGRGAQRADGGGGEAPATAEEEAGGVRGAGGARESPEWRQLLLEQLLQEGLPQEVCDRLEVDFSDSAPGLLAELRGDDAALEAVQVPVVLIHQGVQSESVDATHRDAARCDRAVVSASVVSAMAQLRREWREQWAGHVEELSQSCNQSFQQHEERLRFLDRQGAELRQNLKALDAKVRLQIAQHMAKDPSEVTASAEAAAASVAKRLAEAARRDLEPAVRGVEKDVGKLRHQVSQVNRDLDSLSRAAAVARTGAMDASARTLRSYLVEALVKPPLEEAQELALRLLSQALDAAALLSAHALAPSTTLTAPPAELFAKYETAAETRRLVAQLLADRVGDSSRDRPAADAALALTQSAPWAPTAAPKAAAKAVLPPAPREEREIGVTLAERWHLSKLVSLAKDALAAEPQSVGGGGHPVAMSMHIMPNNAAGPVTDILGAATEGEGTSQQDSDEGSSATSSEGEADAGSVTSEERSKDGNRRRSSRESEIWKPAMPRKHIPHALGIKRKVEDLPDINTLYEPRELAQLFKCMDAYVHLVLPPGHTHAHTPDMFLAAMLASLNAPSPGRPMTPSNDVGGAGAGYLRDKEGPLVLRPIFCRFLLASKLCGSRDSPHRYQDCVAAFDAHASRYEAFFGMPRNLLLRVLSGIVLPPGCEASLMASAFDVKRQLPQQVRRFLDHHLRAATGHCEARQKALDDSIARLPWVESLVWVDPATLPKVDEEGEEKEEKEKDKEASPPRRRGRLERQDSTRFGQDELGKAPEATLRLPPGLWPPLPPRYVISERGLQQWKDGIRQWEEEVNQQSASTLRALYENTARVVLGELLSSQLLEPEVLHFTSRFLPLFTRIFDEYADEHSADLYPEAGSNSDTGDEGESRGESSRGFNLRSPKGHGPMLMPGEEKTLKPREGPPDLMSFNAFFSFCAEFELFPGHASFDELKQIYDSAETAQELTLDAPEVPRRRTTASASAALASQLPQVDIEFLNKPLWEMSDMELLITFFFAALEQWRGPGEMVSLHLLSGEAAVVGGLADSARVWELQTRAERLLRRRLKGLALKGRLLEANSSLQEAGVFHGSELSAFVEGPQMQRTSGAFALLRADGGVVTWGRACPRDGLGHRGVVAQVQATPLGAFAAIHRAGGVSTWGTGGGADCSQVRAQLRDVRRLESRFLRLADLVAQRMPWSLEELEEGGNSAPQRFPEKRARRSAIAPKEDTSVPPSPMSVPERRRLLVRQETHTELKVKEEKKKEGRLEEKKERKEKGLTVTVKEERNPTVQLPPWLTLSASELLEIASPPGQAPLLSTKELQQCFRMLLKDSRPNPEIAVYQLDKVLSKAKAAYDHASVGDCFMLKPDSVLSASERVTRQFLQALDERLSERAARGGSYKIEGIFGDAAEVTPSMFIRKAISIALSPDMIPAEKDLAMNLAQIGGAPNGNMSRPMAFRVLALAREYKRRQRVQNMKARSALLAQQSLRSAWCPEGSRPSSRRGPLHPPQLRKAFRVAAFVECLVKLALHRAVGAATWGAHLVEVHLAAELPGDPLHRRLPT